jgi:Flp pilus assembly protein TadG
MMRALAVLGRLGRAREGVGAVEFGLGASVLAMMTMGLVGAALMGWTRSGLQAAAAATARCVALGAPACAAPQSYAVGLAGQWVFPGVITVADVTVTPATSCNGANGNYTRVTISSGHWAASLLPVPHDSATLTVTACHLSGA